MLEDYVGGSIQVVLIGHDQFWNSNMYYGTSLKSFQ